MKALRRISSVELLYEDVQRATNTYAIQYVIAIKKLKDLKLVEEAVNKVATECPGYNVVLKRGKYYPSENPIIIQKHRSSKVDLYDLDFMREKIDLKIGSIEVHYAKVKGQEYLVFRFAHSVMDGKGTLMFFQSVIDAINNKELLECSNTVRERDFIKKLKYYRKREPKLPNIVHMQAQKLNSYNVAWKMIELDDYVTSVVAKLSCILAGEFENDQTRIMIPTDLRRHDKLNNYTGNLTLPIFLNVKKDDDYKRVNGDLLSQLKDKRELNYSNTLPRIYCYLPKFMRNMIVKAGCGATNMCGKYSIGALVSHLGRIDFDSYKNKAFKVIDFESFPVQQPLGAFSVVIVEYSHKTRIVISYYKDQFDEKYINELMDKIRKTLCPDVYEFNNTDIKYDSNFVRMISNNLKKLGDKTAIIDEETRYTYRELRASVERYTQLFKDYKVKKSIVLYLDRSFDYLSAVLACILNGITFIPVDKTNSLNRLETIVKESDAKFVLSDALFDITAEIILVSEASDKKREKFKVKYQKNKAVYYIYTSGTTGKPKCIPIAQKNLNNYLMWANEKYKTKQQMVAPLFTSLSVDLTITSTLLPFLNGGAVKVFPGNFNQSIIKQIFDDAEINFIKLTPTHLSFWNKPAELDHNVDYVVVGGEALQKNTCDALLELLPETKIINEYGPAEATVGTIVHEYDILKDLNLVPIGQPIDNTKVVLFDKGVIKTPKKSGEILISGDSVFSGYKNNKKRPFAKIDGKKYYRTGDFGYIDNGEIYCDGRKDDQIKVHGFRVELNEIRNVIIENKSIEDAAILYEDEKIYAFVLADEDFDAEKVVSLAREQLPSYEAPNDIIKVDAYPIGTNGKIDKKKLLELIDKSKTDKVNVDDDELLKNQSNKKLLTELGLDSFGLVSFLQDCQEKYIADDRADEFYDEIFQNIGKATVKDLKAAIKKYGKDK